MRAIMATTANPLGFTADSTATETVDKPGFITRFFARLIEARAKRAEVQVQAYLSKLSDDRLQDLGFTSDHIERLRERHYVQAVYWS